jgi:hypothetical protein
MQFDFKKFWPYATAILMIVMVNIFFFLPQFQGKTVRQGDIVQHVAMAKESADFREKTGEQALWTDAIFGGMPTYQIALTNKSNLLSYGERILSLGFARPAGYFIAGMLGMFLLFLLLGVNVWLSLLGALLFGFTTNNLVLFEAGHNSKVMTIMTSPLVIAGVILAYRNKLLAGAAVFGLGLGLNIYCNHPQMTYYLGLCLAILVIVELVKSIMSGKILDFFKASAVLLVMSVLSLGASAGKLWPTYEYTQATMRGGSVLESPSSEKATTTKSGGLDWEYAMQWSNGSGDLLATFIPKAVGGGSGEWIEGTTELAKAVGQRGGMQAPTYWGSLPFTSGPAYYGIVAFFLFVLGMFVIKNELRWWLFGVFLLTTLMSMGKHFDGLNRFLFDTLPMLNKFRAPSSILSITALFIPIAGILALSEIVKADDKSKFIKPVFFATGIVGGVCALLALLGGGLFDFTAAGDEQYAQIKDLLYDQRVSMLKGSALRSLLFVLASAALIYYYAKDKLNGSVLVGGLCLLAVFDIFPIGKDYLDKKDFVNKKSLKNEYQMTPADEQILADKSHYRVFDVSVDPFNSAMGAYYHKLVGGYHPAKLQRYQDMIERHISKGNMGVLNMLNTKYIIQKGQDEQAVVQQNPTANGPAWFADSLVSVKSNIEEISALDSIRSTAAVVHNEFSDYIKGVKTVKGDGQINLTTYTPNKIEYSSKSSTEQLAIFSEIWYGPDKGWEASIDGKAVDHIRANYILRALKVPAGEHKIVFEFKPKSYFMGNTIGLICSSIILLLLGFWAWSSRKNKSLVEKA